MREGNEVTAKVGPKDNTRLLSDLYDQALARRQALYERGELLGKAQMCERLAIDQAELRKAVREGRLFYIEGGRGEDWYPAFFADSASRRHDIERVAVALNPLPGDVKWMFFATPKYSLGGKTPVEALGDGAVASVLRTALEFAEHNRGVETSHTTNSDEARQP
jgi:hypothetical protein